MPMDRLLDNASLIPPLSQLSGMPMRAYAQLYNWLIGRTLSPK